MLKPNFGLKVDGVDLTRVGQKKMDGLLSDLDRYGLLLFPRQLFTDSDIVQFGRRIGDLELSSRRVCLSEEHPEISYLTNFLREDGSPLGFPGSDTDYWHSDQQHRKNPATLAILYCVVPPRVAGETSFVSTAIDSSLPVDGATLERLSAVRAQYEPAHNHDNVDKRRVEHPAILQSAASERSYLYVSENTISFSGIGREEFGNIKKRCLEGILAPDRIYRHKWAAGDFILYDNAQLLHRREAFEGSRWLKATKIFAPKDRFAVPEGEWADSDQTR
ncbi:TauD/TfdA dioxygenase family protein [Streptomyces sp. NPDC058251]|uniref:TauD/TfdA dioxygenase family protein n=1 Tax=unclassified Streptomyces TaxID=2593676 RepID=UPI0036563A16